MLTPLLVQKRFHVFSEKHKKNSLFKFDLCHWVKKKKRKNTLYKTGGLYDCRDFLWFESWHFTVTWGTGTLWLFQWSGNEVKEERLGRKREW